MKLKEVFILTVLLGLVFSCTSEEPIVDPNLPVGGKSQIDITLSMGDLITKAGDPADNYTYATDAEITVADCVIAIFDTNGKKLFYKEASTSDLTTTDHKSEESMTPVDKKVLTYHVKNVEIPWGKDMTVVVIANSDQSYSSYTDLAGFKTAVETTTAFTNPTFDPKKLVKVGILKTDITTATTAIEVPMVQLAARVDLKLAITATDGLDVSGGQTEVSYELAGFVQEMTEKVRTKDIKLDNSGQGPVPGYTINANQNVDKQDYVNKTYTFYLEHGPVTIPSKAQIVRLYPSSDAPDDQWLGQKVLSRKIQWGLDLKSITIENILLKSDVLLAKWGTLDFSNTQKSITANMGSLTWTNPAEGQEGHIDTFAGDQFILTFYTYEKEFAKAPMYAENPLRIVVDANIIQSSVSKVERYGGLYGVWYNMANKEILPNENGAPPTTVFTIIPGTETDQIGGEIEVIETEGKTYPKQFAFIINPQTGQPNYTSNTNGVIHGNLYSVAATVKNVNINVEVDLEYAVVGWNTKTIKIPTFE